MFFTLVVVNAVYLDIMYAELSFLSSAPMRLS
jgi:hypothetical protein